MADFIDAHAGDVAAYDAYCDEHDSEIDCTECGDRHSPKRCPWADTCGECSRTDVEMADSRLCVDCAEEIDRAASKQRAREPRRSPPRPAEGRTLMRTAQDLLAERRACVMEQTRSDRTERAMLQFRIDQIDRELHERRQAIPVVRAAGVLHPPTRPCRICGLSPCDPADHVFADATGPSEPRTYDEMFAAARAAIAEFTTSHHAGKAS